MTTAIRSASILLLALVHVAGCRAPPGAEQPAATDIGQTVAEMDITGSVSPDGRLVSYTDWGTGDLAVRDLTTGEDRHLTRKGSWFDSEEFALFSAFSPDGGRLAYGWSTGDDQWDIRVIGVDGSDPRVLYREADTHYVEPWEWSRDGRRILASIHQRDGRVRIGLVSVEDGSARIVSTVEWGRPPRMFFSTDGRHVAYSAPPREDAPHHDLYTVALEDGEVVAVVEGPADDRPLGWTPDGAGLLFARARGGMHDLWFVPVADGRRAADPRLIAADLGPVVSPLGFTSSGSYFYGRSTWTNDVYLAALEPPGGGLGPPERVGARAIPASSAAFSPDGRYLAYAPHHGEPLVVSIRSLDTGEERELPPLRMRRFHALEFHWSPDGRSLLAQGRMPHDIGLFRIDAATGVVSHMVESERAVEWPAWSRDGRIFFARFPPDRAAPQILVAYDPETGDERELHRVGEHREISRVAVSPDGGWLAFLVADEEREVTALTVMSTAGGEPREVVRARAARSIRVLAWMSDSRHVLYATPLDGATGFRLWRVSRAGGEPQPVGAEIEGMLPTGLSVHPDGQRIAYTAGSPSRAEVRVLEDFLPPPAEARSPAAQWNWQNPRPQGHPLSGVAWISPDVAVAVGFHGTIVRSTDAGRDWVAVASGVIAALRGVGFEPSATASPQGVRGVAVGAEGVILLTTDGGLTWETRASGTERELRALAFADAMTAVAVGRRGTVLRSEDGGVSWTAVPSGTRKHLRSVRFDAGGTGVAVGDGGTVLVTSDAGRSWTRVRSRTWSALRSVALTDDGSWVAVGGDDSYLRRPQVIVRSEEGGRSWRRVPAVNRNRLYAVSFAAGSGLAVGDEGVVLRSADGGRSWVEGEAAEVGWLSGVGHSDVGVALVVAGDGQVLLAADPDAAPLPIQANPRQGVNALTFVDDWTAIAVGEGGLLARSTDGGESWAVIETGHRGTLFDVHFRDQTHGIAVGGGPIVLVTTDAGETWERVTMAVRHFHAVHYGPGDGIVAAGLGGRMFRSEDRGGTWETRIVGNTHFTGLSFPHADTGYAVAEGGAALRTTDGGRSWEPLQTGTRQNLYSVQFTDSRRGLAVGGGGVILATGDGGETWTVVPSGTTNALRGVHFLDALNGIIVGFNGTVLRTADGGESWRAEESGTVLHLTDATYRPDGAAFAAGWRGVILSADPPASPPIMGVSSPGEGRP